MRGRADLKPLHIVVTSNEERVYFPKHGRRGFSFVTVVCAPAVLARLGQRGKVFTLTGNGEYVLHADLPFYTLYQPTVVVDVSSRIIRDHVEPVVYPRVTGQRLVQDRNGYLHNLAEVEERWTQTISVSDIEKYGYDNITVSAEPDTRTPVFWGQYYAKEYQGELLDGISIDSHPYKLTELFDNYVWSNNNGYIAYFMGISRKFAFRIKAESINGIRFSSIPGPIPNGFEYQLVGFGLVIPAHCVSFVIRKKYDLLPADPAVVVKCHYAGANGRIIPLSFASYVPATHVQLIPHSEVTLKGGGDRDFFRYTFDADLADTDQDFELEFSLNLVDFGDLFPWP